MLLVRVGEDKSSVLGQESIVFALSLNDAPNSYSAGETECDEPSTSHILLSELSAGRPDQTGVSPLLQARLSLT